MSQDGRSQLISIEIAGKSQPAIVMDCGAPLVSNSGGRYRRCVEGHLHCTRCHRLAHRFNKGLTCGSNCQDKRGTA
jgi:hypothetical protein